ncbi:nucleolar protein 56 [Clonorchis sinensis]|uniref:Nucleolar protein 56 n=1 Tax=Clonorchis sinensis TaxID=79923 RepID=G7Y331_CLOSI|nr:nucleolar protein 56 [Clonorchis sinensis]
MRRMDDELLVILTLEEEYLSNDNLLEKKFILFEHALGYALLRVKAADVESIVELAKELLDDDETFCKSFKLHAFSPFSSSASALQNCNAVSEGMVHEDLKNFLMENLPLDGATMLCVAERKLADAIKSPEAGFPDTLTCSSESILTDAFRALRLRFPTYIKELSHFAESKAQLGLGHSYSRAKVKFNVNRNDNMIIQSINLLDQLDKDVNVFCMRVKEWFSYHFPELIKIVPDNVTFVKVIGVIGTREGITQDKLEALEAIVDSERAQMIVDAATSSFGFDITEEDAEHLTAFTEKILSLVDRRKQLQDYLASKLSGVAPNLSTLIGDRVSARLISHAGSLMNLAKFPASTIQILGAEKALFRALRRRGRTPKYGLIFHSPFITRAARENKGRISRFLAAKCAIACRLDCFSEILSDIYGKHLKKQIEDRLNFFETGQTALTNAEAMEIANAEARKFIRKMKKKAITILNHKAPITVHPSTEMDGESVPSVSISKKKKKKLRQMEEEEVKTDPDQDEAAMKPESNEITKPNVGKKKKKRHLSECAATEVKPAVVRQNRKRSASESSVVVGDAEPNHVDVFPKKKKKRMEAAF